MSDRYGITRDGYEFKVNQIAGVTVGKFKTEQEAQQNIEAFMLFTDCPDLTNSAHSLYNIWNAASVILGFQLLAFSWRIQREAELQRQEKPTWLPVADKLNLAAILVNIIGTFLLPIAGHNERPEYALAFSLILFATYPLALAAHYELFFRHWNRKRYFPRQERIIADVLIACFAVAAFYRSRWCLGVILIALLVALLAYGWWVRRYGKENEPGEPIAPTAVLGDAKG
jgi:hypothetical protein